AQAIGPALAIGLDAISFLVSALSLAAIRVVEPAPTRSGSGGVIAEIGEGLRALWHRPVLSALLAYIAISNVFGGAILAVYVLYASRDVGLAPTTVGLIFGAAGPGAFLGALLAGRLARRLGPGRTLLWTAVISIAKLALLPLAALSPALGAPL